MYLVILLGEVKQVASSFFRLSEKDSSLVTHGHARRIVKQHHHGGLRMRAEGSCLRSTEGRPGKCENKGNDQKGSQQQQEQLSYLDTAYFRLLKLPEELKRTKLDSLQLPKIQEVQDDGDGSCCEANEGEWIEECHELRDGTYSVCSKAN